MKSNFKTFLSFTLEQLKRKLFKEKNLIFVLKYH